ncbi:MAG: hypothetical protein AABY75_08865, partial [Bacteroidota bacterium]
RIVPPLRDLKEDFRSLWLTTNQEAGLEWLMKRYGRQAAYWIEKRAQVERGEVWVDPETPSAWIYHPNGNPGKRDSSATQVRNAVFRRNFTLPDTFATTAAWLQLIGDSHARVEVNGASVGEVFARRSLSLIVEHERVKAWDIAHLLKAGDNTIVIRTDSYATFGSAGVNVWCRVDGMGGGAISVHSDTTWQVREEGSVEAAWIQARTVASPLPVIAPSPAAGRWSWIER